MTPRICRASQTAATNPSRMYAWEPPLNEILADPVVQAMMAVDGVRPNDVVSLLSEARERRDEPLSLG